MYNCCGKLSIPCPLHPQPRSRVPRLRSLSPSQRERCVLRPRVVHARIAPLHHGDEHGVPRRPKAPRNHVPHSGRPLLVRCRVERLREEKDLEEADMELLLRVQCGGNEWAAASGAVPNGERPSVRVQRYCRAVKANRRFVRGSCVRGDMTPLVTANNERKERRTYGEIIRVEVAHLRVDVKCTIVRNLDSVRAEHTTLCR